jgi:hypothetical protein
MKIKTISYLVYIFVFIAVLYPIWDAAGDLLLSPSFKNLFPVFGLMAASLLWIHSISGVFENWLRKYINFDLFISVTATIIFVCIVLHPLLLFIDINFNLPMLLKSVYIQLGLIAWLLLITYDIGKFLKKTGYAFFAKHWTSILIISNIGFLITFIHSLALGGDLRSGGPRMVWIFYGITATLSIVYTYAVRPLLQKKSIRKLSK